MRDGLPSVIGHYALERELGRGGMGAVFVARDTRLDRQVALKVMLHTDLSQVALQRFEREAQAVAAMDHPGIVRIHELGTHEGRTFIVMDLVEGESLQALLAREGPLPAGRAVELTRALAHAVQHAHERQVLHRDIKPANVLIDAQGRAVLTDFGLARDLSAARERLTLTGELVGTPAFMAPEQADGKLAQLGPWTDVYGLGVTLYCMLTGRAPFEGQGVNLLYTVLSQEAPPPSSLRPEVAHALDVVCGCALAKKPKHRYPSAAALAEDLQRFLSGERLSAKPRRRTSPALLAGVGLVLVGACAVGLTAFLRHQRSSAVVKAEEAVQALVAEAAGALRGPAGRDPAWPDRWRQRRARFEAALPPDAGTRRALEEAEAIVLTAEGLRAVDAGEMGVARHGLTRLGEAPSAGLLAAAIAAVTTSADHQVAAEGLKQARAEGYRWPSLDRWLAEAQLRALHAVYLEDRPSKAAEQLSDVDFDAVPPGLRDTLWRGVREDVLRVAREIERWPPGKRMSDQGLRRFGARLRVLSALRPAQPLPPEDLKALLDLVRDPVRNIRLRFGVLVSGLALEDYEVQRGVLDRRTFMNRQPRSYRSLSKAFVPVARRALALAPPGERAAVLEALGDLLHGSPDYTALGPLATDLLAEEGLSELLRAKAHYFRACHLHRLGKLQDALEAADRALELHSLPMAHFRRSKLSYQLAEANVAREKASRLPEEGKALRSIYRREFAQAAREAQSFLERVDLEQNAELKGVFDTAVVYAFDACRKARSRSAYRAARRAIELYLERHPGPEYAGWWLRLAHTQVRLKDWTGARVSLSQALTLGEGDPRLAPVLKTTREFLPHVGERGTTSRMQGLIDELRKLRDSETHLP